MSDLAQRSKVGEDYAELISALDVRRKVTLLTGASAFTLAAEPSIGLGEVGLSDGPPGSGDCSSSRASR
jgi:beta-glucosidase